MNQFLKTFLQWFELKPKLDSKKSKPPFVKEGQIWWIYAGENIGTEISGKGENYTRPALIYKKFSQYTYFVIPLSTQRKTGTWYVPSVFCGKSGVACLHQAKSIDYRRLDKVMENLSEHEFEKIQYDFEKLYSHKKLTPNEQGSKGDVGYPKN